jgi:hypothetical protein
MTAMRTRASLVALAVLVVSSAAVFPSRALAVTEPPEPTADGAGAEKYRPIVDAAVAQVAAQLGLSPLSKPPFIQPLKQKVSGGGQYAHTWDYGDPVDTCLIQLQPAAQQLGPADLQFVLTHEVVHCYQDRETNGADVTNWVEEGAATWVAAKIAPGSAIAKSKWQPYLSEPVKSLFFRAYDGVGFFGHLEYVGVDVWPRIVPMMQAGSDAAAFDLAVAGSTATLDNWAPGLAREPSFGAPWSTDGPDIPATKPPRVAKAVTNTTNFSMPIIKAGNVLLDLDVKADVVVVDGSAGAHGRLRDAGGADWLIADVSGRSLCALPEGCACPDGSAGAGIQFEPMASGSALLGLTGGADGAKVVVRGRSLDEYCAKPAKMDPCLVGTWIGQGVSISLPEIDIVGMGGKGGILKFEKNGTGSVDLDASTAVAATLPGDLVGTFKLSGQAGGIVNASQGVMTTLTTSISNLRMEIDVPPLGSQTVPLSAGDVGIQPFDGLYTCSKTTLVYSAPGFGGQSTWARQ